MVYSIDSKHLIYDHMCPKAIQSDFDIIPERLNQIFIVAHDSKEKVLSFPVICHSSKSVTCIQIQILRVSCHASKNVRPDSIMYL